MPLLWRYGWSYGEDEQIRRRGRRERVHQLMDLTVPQPLALPMPGVVPVWQLPCAAAQLARSHWQAWLSPEERDRAQQYRHPRDRDRFILGRGGLRYLLASYLGIAPTAIQLGYGPHGKPYLRAPHAANMHFNVAHSGDWVIWGFSHSPHIGVDVETLQPRRYLSGLMQRCLTAAERDQLPPDPLAQLEIFLRYWTIKEAHLKAIGLGLSYSLQAVQVALQPTPQIMRAAHIPGQPVLPWGVQLWQPGPGAIAAVCVDQTQYSLQLLTLGNC